ncbi:MAG: aspartate aminotransferase family protein [Pseudomonadota bacterium]
MSASLSASELKKLDAEHYLHPFSNYQEIKQKGSLVIKKADGVWLWDANGNQILDGMAGLWCVNVGYGRRELADVAHAQMLELPYYNSFFKTSHTPAITLSKALSEITPPQFNHVFFTGSGSESNDTIVRMVRQFWALQGKPEKRTIISRWNAYHGSTMAGASLGGMKPMHQQGGLPIPEIEHISQPFWYRYEGNLDEGEFGKSVAAELEAKINELDVDKVAAFIAEPIQGAGGVIVPPETYWPEISRICKEYGICLIADEVICGFGRTGHWFGSDLYDLEPDFMPIAKGLSSGYLPIGGVMVSDRIAQVFVDSGSEFEHGYTYSGHPAACAVAIENIRILREEKIVENVHDVTGPYLQSRWQELADHPLVGEARGKGFFGALELVTDKASKKALEKPGALGTICRDHSIASGLMMRSVGDSMIISPPLVATKSEIDELINRASQALNLTAKDVL